MKVITLFPGYSAQFVGMGKEFYDEYRIVQEYFEEASNCLNINFVKLCFASSDLELAKIHNAYTALFLVNTAIAKLLLHHNLKVDMVAGYCDGEYAALAMSDCINFPDGLYLLSKYSSFYEEFLKNTNIVLLRVNNVQTGQLQEICAQASDNQHTVSIAIYHTASDHIIVGHREAVERVQHQLYQQPGVELTAYSAGIGVHSPLVDEVVNQLRMYLEKVDFKDLQIPLLSALDGKVVTSGQEVKTRVLQDINVPLHFNLVTEAIKDYDVIIEIGNRTPLHSMIQQQYSDKRIVEIKKCSDLDILQQILNK